MSPFSLSLRRAYAAHLVAAAIGVCAVPANVAPCFAAPSSPKIADTLTGDAKDAFNRARVLFAKGDFAAARKEYERAFDASKDARVLYNVAVCLKEEGKYAAAIRVLEQSTSSAQHMPADHMQRVADTVDTLTALVATVTAEGLTSEMTIEVDGEVVGTASGKFLVDAGTRRVAVRRPGFAPQSFTRDFPAAERFTFVVALAPLPGKLRITSEATRDATVVLDGREVGLAPLIMNVAPGAHEIVLRAPGFRESRRNVEVTSDREVVLEVPLERDARTARLRVLAGPREAIHLDGNIVGTGAFDGTVSAGEHRVLIARADGGSQTIEVALRENEVRDLRIASPEAKSGGIPVWAWAIGGAVAVGAISTGIYFATRPTEFEGSTPGTLSPRVVPAHVIRGGL